MAIDAQLDGALGKPPEFVVRTKDFRLDAGHHARHGLIADFRESLLAEIEEGQVGAIAEQQKLEMVLPHPEIAFERFLIRFENVVVRGDPAAGVDVLQRLELRKLNLRQRLGVPNQTHHLVFPLSEETLPVCVVVEGAPFKLFVRLAISAGSVTALPPM